MTVEINQPAPDFSAPATGGQTLSLKDFAGKTVVLYFYPRDNTPGCTLEGQTFRDHIDAFTAANTVILGVSRDSIRKHENFKAKQSFPFELLADEDEVMCNTYGVLKEKNMFGKKAIGIERSTFVIDGQGVIRHIWRKVKVPGHVEEVLEKAQQL